MHFVQYYLDCLSQASYLVGDEGTGRAVVVDPRRDVEIYLDDADAHDLRIERVIETHIHADFLSGHLELAAKTGAAISRLLIATNVRLPGPQTADSSLFCPEQPSDTLTSTSSVRTGRTCGKSPRRRPASGRKLRSSPGFLTAVLRTRTLPALHKTRSA